jgi:hypothetical protein
MVFPKTTSSRCTVRGWIARFSKKETSEGCSAPKEANECYIDGWTITCTQFQPRRRISSKKQKWKHGKSQEITSRSLAINVDVKVITSVTVLRRVHYQIPPR